MYQMKKKKKKKKKIIQINKLLHNMIKPFVKGLDII